MDPSAHQPPVPPSAVLEALVSLLEGQASITRTLARIERKAGKIMALDQAEQAAVDQLTAGLTKLGTDIDAVLAAVTAWQQSLKDTITALETLRDSLQAANTADEAQIATLNATITALEAQQASADADVVGALGTLSTALDGLDQHVNSLAPTP